MNEHMRQLADVLPGVLRRSRAESSARKYDGGFRRWSSWAEEQHIQNLPADPLHIALYLVELIQSATSPSPVTTAIYSISWAHKTEGLADPTANDIVQRVHQGAQRLLSSRRVRKTPVSKAEVTKMLQCLNIASALSDLQTAVLITVGYAGLLRWNDLSKICVDEIIFKRDYMAVFLESRKNDQLRHGNWIFISRWEGKHCPVKLTEQLIARGRLAGHVKLFGKVRKGRIEGQMSYTRAREIFREALTRAGYDPAAYGLHSLRAGGATVATAAGIPDRLVKRQGGWRSESAMLAYLEESMPSLLQVSKALGI